MAKTIENREQKIKMLKDLQRGVQRNIKLKAICKKVLPLIDSEEKAKLKNLIANPFSTASDLYEVANDGVLSRLLDAVNNSKDEDGECIGITICQKEVELLDELLKFKPQ